MDATYTALPDTFQKEGFTYTLLARTERVALYSQACQGFLGYEVCRIQRQEAGQHLIAGATVVREAKELLPGKEAWGTSGWTYCTLAAAQAKFQQQVAHFAQKAATK